LDEDCLMALRASIDRSYALPFKVGVDTFIEWQQDSSDLGGYEYDAQRKEIIIKSLPGLLHERVVGVFIDWFVQIKQRRFVSIAMMGSKRSNIPLKDDSTMVVTGHQCWNNSLVDVKPCEGCAKG
jgi:hypothetical protein